MKASEGYSHRSFVHAGRRLAYEVHGHGDRLLVYLNALLMDANLNRPMAQALAARGNRVVLLDLLGHGLSDKPAQMTEHRIDVYTEQVIALLDHLGARDAVLGGISLGANVSLFAAAHEPERTRGLVLEMPVMEHAVPVVALTFVPFILGLYYARRPAALLTALVRRVPRGVFPPLDSVLNAASLPPDQMAAVLHGVLLGPVTPTLKQRQEIAVPTIVIGHGADLIHPFSDAEAIVRQLQDARLVRATSMLELRIRPARLTAEIAEFLDDVWRSPSVRTMTA